MSSTFEVPIVIIKKRPHTNADSLSIVDVFGWQVVVRTEEWQDGDLAAYVPPDSVVPDTPEWKFLDGHLRIKTRRFRKEWSHGLLVKAPEGSKCGDNVASKLNITPYEPPSSRLEGPSSREAKRRKTWFEKIKSIFLEVGNRPSGVYPYYDVENIRRFKSLIPDGTEVIITEKVHGANALYVNKKPWYSRKPRLYMRSRSVWKPRFLGGAGFYRGVGNVWKRALENTPSLQTFLAANPNIVVYGEVYGKGVQELEYGLNDVAFAAFDIWVSGQWQNKAVTFNDLEFWKVPVVPQLYKGPFDFNKAVELANGKSRLCPGQLQEGVVVTTLDSPRKQLKLISDVYLEKAK